jgi:hypothetical protein
MEAAAFATAAQHPPASSAPLHRGRTQPPRSPRSRKPGRIVAIIAIGRKSVDLARVEPGIGAGGQNSLESELEFRVRRSAVAIVLGLAYPDDRYAAPKRAICPGHYV